MLSLSYSKGHLMLLMGHATLFFDYFEMPNYENDFIGTVLLYNNGHIVMILSFSKSDEFIKLMSDL